MAQKKVWEFEGDWYIQVGENLPFCINTEEVANELANYISNQVEKPVKPERAEMKLYKVLLAYSYNNEKIFTFLVVASCIEEATDLAIKTFKSYDYGDCQFSSVSLLAEEGQYGKPQILIIAEH